MRYEKIPFEKLFNSKVVKRNRAIETPLKWNNTRPHANNQLYATFQMSLPWYRKYFNTVLPIISWFHWTWRKEWMHNEGVTWDDHFLYEEGDMRRNEFFQHVMARNFHPYELNLYKYRRMRYFKVEETYTGFIVPEYLKKEARDRLFTDFYQKRVQWENFIHDNYGAELSLGIRVYPTGMAIPLDLFVLTGWLDHRNWDRMFYNETLHGGMTETEVDFAYNPKLPFDLSTERGKKDFAEQYEHLHKYLPGFLAKEGEKLNIPRMIAQAKNKHNKELSTEEKSLLKEFHSKCLEDQKLLEDKPAKNKILQKIGSIMPKVLTNWKPGKALMSK